MTRLSPDLLGSGPLPDHALRLAQLPFQQGGLNLRSAVALAPAAYWASWADTLPVLHRQLPRFAADVVARLGAGEPVGPTLRGVLQSQAALAPPPPSPMSQATTCPNPARGAGRRQLRPQSPRISRRSSRLSWMCPRRPFCFPRLALTFPSEPLRALLLQRLRLPLPLSARTCQCRRPLGPLGDHRAACSRSGALRSRGCPLERAAARVCREPGARVTTNTLVRDLNVAVSRLDDRRIEVIANGRKGLPLRNGAQLAVDTTIVSPLTAAGGARSRRDPARPVSLLEARRRKEATYPELLASARCRLVVIGVEAGWGSEAASFLRLLARARTRAAPEAFRPALRSAYVHRWSGLLCAAASLAFADSLTSLPSPGLSNLDGPCPDLSDLLAACPSSPGASRLSAR